MYPFKSVFSSFPDICPGVGALDHMVTLFVVVLNHGFNVHFPNNVLFAYSSLMMYLLTSLAHFFFGGVVCPTSVFDSSAQLWL